MLRRLYRLASKLPLPVLHAVGALAGLVAWLVPNRFAARTRFHIALCLPELAAGARRRLVRAALIESGKALAELPLLWSGPADRVARLARRVEGWERVEAAVARGKGIVGASPHLGSWELAGLDYSRRLPLVSLYKESGTEWDPVMKSGRERFGATLVSGDRAGMRKLFEALRAGWTAGVLPDQDPPPGSGVFAPFFGIAAHSPVFAVRLARRTGATFLYVYAERLPRGAGFVLHIDPAPEGIDDEDEAKAVAAMNRGVEACIRKFPAQYWWAYKRFRRRPEGEPSLYP